MSQLLKGGIALSGELFRNNQTEINTEKCESAVVVEDSMEKVTQTLCPDYFCIKKEGVTYGTKEGITYYSETTGCERKANVLLPPDYSPDKKYPVLYFLHGIFGDENSMIGEESNKLDIIFGNLKADGIIDDAILIFPNMFATGDPNIQPGFNSEQTAPYDNFINDLVNDLIPFIEKKYSVISDREHRGLIGFSMGGRETLFIGLMRSDLIASFCAISSAPGLVPSQDNFMKHDGQFADEQDMCLKTDSKPDMIMVCCGTQDSVVGKFPSNYHRILSENEIDHLWFEVPGADHNSDAIRSGYYNFLIRWKGIRV